MNATATTTAQLALNMASEQLEQGWIEVDEDKYALVENRLVMVKKLLRDAEKELKKLVDVQ